MGKISTNAKQICAEQLQHGIFHLNMACLCKNDSSVEYRDITMNDEFFQNLTREQIEILHAKGFLKHIAAKKF